MEFKMDKYLEVKENGFPKVIIGIRRCGRFYLLDTIYREYFNMMKTWLKSSPPNHSSNIKPWLLIG